MFWNRFTAAVFLVLAGILVPVVAFYPYASAEPQRRAKVSQAVAAEPPATMPWVIPSGTAFFNSPIVLEDVDGVVIRGYGSSKVSRLVYTGPPTKGFIQLIGCGRCRLENFEIVIAVPGVESAVLVTNRATPNPNGRISTGNVLDGVRVMHGGYPTAAKRAFSVDSTAAGGNANNNEHHKFRNCYAQSFTQAGYYLNGNQAHQIVFDGCIAHDAGGRRPIGLLAEDGSYFRWVNGAMAWNSIDFKTDTMEHMNVIDFHSSESSGRFLVSGRVGGESFTSISNVRWDGAPTGANSPVVDCYGPGPWTIRNSWFAGTNGVCPTMRFSGATASSASGSLSLDGVMVRQHGGTQPVVPIITAPSTWESRFAGVKYQFRNAAGIPTNKPITGPNKVPGQVVVP